MIGPTVCSALNGKIALKHPELGVLVREDGAVLMRECNRNHWSWTFGGDGGIGYLRVRIASVKRYVHRLVATCFCKNPENKPFVDHINRNPGDNRASNLRWVTTAENMRNCDRIDAIVNKPVHQWIREHRHLARVYSNGVVGIPIRFGNIPGIGKRWVPIRLAARLAKIPCEERVYEDWMSPLAGNYAPGDPSNPPRRKKGPEGPKNAKEGAC